MENRATDHVLGCMGLDGFDGIPPGGRMLYKNASHPELGGLNVSCGTAEYVCTESMSYGEWNPKFSPDAANELRYPYSEQSDANSYNALGGKSSAAVKMFSRAQLPVKASLADNFAALNKYYSGVPSASTPNHDYIQTATSCGLRDNRNYRACGGATEMFPQFTMYDM